MSRYHDRVPPFPLISWRELLTRLQDQYGVELRQLSSATTGLYRKAGDDHFYFRPGPSHFNNSVTPGEFYDVCEALHIDPQELMAGD